MPSHLRWVLTLVENHLSYYTKIGAYQLSGKPSPTPGPLTKAPRAEPVGADGGRQCLVSGPLRRFWPVRRGGPDEAWSVEQRPGTRVVGPARPRPTWPAERDGGRGCGSKLGGPCCRRCRLFALEWGGERVVTSARWFRWGGATDRSLDVWTTLGPVPLIQPRWWIGECRGRSGLPGGVRTPWQGEARRKSICAAICGAGSLTDSIVEALLPPAALGYRGVETTSSALKTT
ncbi:hypothetical protein NDU88_003655 [Pleurodeles waltl]|uniref:Uncharacterized protein n=1 Tax=Pleurodeles waltl TaxID=8319 RepID=A0AAV7PAJ0_PLEWA|nr:hypothetical protein NDU88_003655 [Pleurodeles waltl]